MQVRAQLNTGMTDSSYAMDTGMCDEKPGSSVSEEIDTVLASDVDIVKDHSIDFVQLGKDSLLAVAVEVLIILSRCEFLYSTRATSGSYNILIAGIFLLIGFLICCYKKVEFHADDAAKIAVIGFVGLWAYDQNAIRYALVLCLLLFWNKIKFFDLSLLCRSLIVIGFLASFITGVSGTTGRWTGFFLKSSPMFALTITICITYLTFYRNAHIPSKVDTAFIFLGLILVVLTQTRLFILAAAIIIAYGYLWNVMVKFIPQTKIRKVIFAVVILALGVGIMMNSDMFMSILSRDNGESSNRTRIVLMTLALSEFVSTPMSILIGHGGGYITNLIEIATGSATYFPLHQDVLLYLTDYGIFGLAVVAVAFFSRTHWHWYMWMLFFLATFHNVMTSGATMLILFICFQSLIYREEKYKARKLEAENAPEAGDTDDSVCR